MAVQKLQGASGEKQTHPWSSPASAGTPISPLQEEPRRKKPPQRLGFVRQYLISPSLTPATPRGGSVGPVCMRRTQAAGRQTAAGKRPSITAPFIVSPPHKGRKRGRQALPGPVPCSDSPMGKHPTGMGSTWAGDVGCRTRDARCAAPRVALATCRSRRLSVMLRAWGSQKQKTEMLFSGNRK